MPKIDIALNAIIFSNAAGTDTLQGAINQAIVTSKPLYIAQGVYTVTTLTINNSVKIYATKNSVTIRSSGTSCFFIAIESATQGARISDVVIEGIILDGENKPFTGGLSRPGLIRAQNVDRLTVQDCFVGRSDGSGIDVSSVTGFFLQNEFVDCRNALSSVNSIALTIRNNTIRDSKDNGIIISRSAQNADGSLITGNKIFTVNNVTGGSGQFGNGVFVFLSNNITVTENIFTNCNYSAVRFAHSSNSVISNNQISGTRETAIFVEAPDDTQASYQGATINGNTIFDAGNGINVVNSNAGSRRATISANTIKNLTQKSFDGWVSPTRNAADRYTITTIASGITGSADISVTSNVIESCAVTGIVLAVSGTFNTDRFTDQVQRY